VAHLARTARRRGLQALPATKTSLNPRVTTAIELGKAANADLLPLPTRHEWGEGRGEGNSRKNGPPLPSPLLPRREEREKIELPSAAPPSNSTAVPRLTPS